MAIDQGELERRIEATLSEEERKKYSYGSEKNLEDIVRNHRYRSPFRKLLDYTIGIASMAVSYLIAGPIGPVAGLLGVTGDYINCKIRKRDFPSRQFRNTASIWSLFAIPGSMFYKWLNATFNVKTIVGWAKRMLCEFLGLHFTFLPVIYSLTYPIETLQFKGLYNVGLKKVYWKNLKATAKYFFLPEALLARFAPPAIQFPAILLSRTFYTVTWGSRGVRMVDPYIYDHRKIKGQSIYDLGKQYGIIPGEGRGRPVPVPNPEEYKKPKQNLQDKMHTYRNNIHNYVTNGYDKIRDYLTPTQLQPAFAYNRYR